VYGKHVLQASNLHILPPPANKCILAFVIIQNYETLSSFFYETLINFIGKSDIIYDTQLVSIDPS
jgi:hypothetical protein